MPGDACPDTDAELQLLYPTHADYLCRMQQKTDAAVAAGFLLPEDAVDLMSRAAAATNRWLVAGNPDVCCGGAGTPCDDGNPCTEADTCDASGACVGRGPLTGCLTPAVAGRASVRLVDRPPANDRSDAISWRWIKGTTLKGQFGDPTASTAYTLCVRDGADRHA